MAQSPRTEKVRGFLNNNNQNWKEHEPIIVGDQHGLVIVWEDQHTSRFLWSDLRLTCPCPQCYQRRTTVLRTVSK